MTPTELRDLDAWLAVHLFGWEWLERMHDDGVKKSMRKCLFPPSDSETWIRTNFNPASWSPAQISTERFSDWDRGGFTDTEGLHAKRKYFGLQHYTNDQASAMDVLQWCVSRERIGVSCYRIDIHHGGVYYVSCWAQLGIEVEAGTLELAICLFAKEMYLKLKLL